MVDESHPHREAQTGSTAPEILKKKRSRLIIIGAVIVIFLIILAAILTLSVHPDMPPEQGASYPYTTTYAVLIPDGQVIQIAGTSIIALTAGEEMIMKIGERNEKFVVGETKTISERRAEFQILGLPILSTNYLIEATYRGRSGNNADFYLLIRTSRQVPSFLVERILPGEINARPV